MARPLRIEFAGALYSITSRGLYQQPIVMDDEDREKWLSLLDRVATRRQWRVYAWVLMTNHFHLFVQTPLPNLSAGMHDLNSGYASCFNRRHGRIGPLFEGRFYGVLVETERYDLELTRYVHLNPVRAGMVARPEDYAWSSFREYLSRDSAPAWLAWESVLSRFGVRLDAALSSFLLFHARARVNSSDSPFDRELCGSILGSESFIERIKREYGEELFDGEIPESRALAPTPGLQTIQDVVSAVFDVDPGELHVRGRHSEARCLAMLLARELSGKTLAIIGEYFGGVSRSGASKSCRRVEARFGDQPELVVSYQECLGRLRQPQKSTFKT